MKNLGELKFPETRWEVDSAAVHQDINQQIGSNFAGLQNTITFVCTDVD